MCLLVKVCGGVYQKHNMSYLILKEINILIKVAVI